MFSAEQEGAIDLGRLGQDSCIVAGPGSGKTAVLVERYRRLLEQGCDPSRILVITFTEKAAANMKKRIAKASPGMLAAIREAPIHTVDAFCARLLRENAIQAGVDPDFSILDERRVQVERVGSVAEALNALLAERRAEMLDLAESFGGQDLAGALDDVYEAIRSAGVPLEAVWRRQYEPVPVQSDEIDRAVERFLDASTRARTDKQKEQRAQVQRIQTELAARLPGDDAELYRILDLPVNGAKNDGCADLLRELKAALEKGRVAITSAWNRGRQRLLAEILMRFEEIYTARKRALGMLDFADLITLTVRLLEANPAVRERIAGQYEHVFMDEFQDTNEVQERLLKLLRGPGNFFAVGDVNQSIFGFRHALPEVFRAYREEVQAREHHLHELKENWRSRAEILRAAEQITHGRPGVETRRLLARRPVGEKPEPSIDVLIASGENALEVEAEWVAKRIVELHETLRIDNSRAEDGSGTRRARFRDFAILLRAAERQIARFAAALERAGVPHLLTRRANFFEEREATDLRRVLAMLANPLDEISTAAVLRAPLVGISDEALFLLKERGTLAGGLEALNPDEPGHYADEDWRRLLRFRGNLAAWRELQPYCEPDRLLLRVLDDCGYVWDPGSPAGARIEKFLSIVRGYGRTLPLRELCDLLDRMQQDNAREQDAPIDENFDAVRLLTAHASKGLEFPVVIIPAMDKGTKSTDNPILFSKRHGLGAKWKVPGTLRKTCPDYALACNTKDAKARDEDEADRLLYVALTRAEEHLVLSWCGERKPGNWADVVVRQLGLGEVAVDGAARTVECESPHGEPFAVRVMATAQMPEPFRAEGGAAGLGAVEFLARPELDEQQDASVTVTALTQFAGCPRKYYLGRYLGLESAPRGRRFLSEEEEPEPRLDAGELGTQVHDLLAGLEVPDADLRARGMAQRFELSALGKRARKAARSEAEWAFLIAIEDVIVTGTIDLWFDDGRDLILVDYKTDDVSPLEARERAREYQSQLRLYALALERHTGRRPARAYLHFLRPDELVEVSVAGDLEREAARLVGSLAAAQNEGDFPLNPGAQCERCAFFRGLCPAGTGAGAESHGNTFAMLP